MFVPSRESNAAAGGYGKVSEPPPSTSAGDQQGEEVQSHDFAQEEKQAAQANRSKDEKQRPETTRAPLEGLELLLNYLGSLRDQPCTLLDISQAQSYASYPTSEREVDAETRPPIRIWSSQALTDLMEGRRWIIDCLSARSRAVLREFLLDVSMDRPPHTLKLEFVLKGTSTASDNSGSAKKPAFLVTFNVGLVTPTVIPKHLRSRYPNGLAVLTGTIRREADLATSSQRASSSHPQHQDRASSPAMSFAPIVSSSTFTRRKLDSEKGSLSDITSFALDTFQQQACRIGDTEAGKLLMNFPWHETSLGAINSWPPRFMGYITFALSQPTPIIIGLGSDYLQIYNDAYIQKSGNIHPSGFGQPGSKAWGSAWYSTLGPLVQRSIAEKRSFTKKDHLFWQQPSHIRHGVNTSGKDTVEIFDEQSITLLETYRTVSHGPLFAHNGVEVDGYAGLDIDTTDSVIARRRLATARDLQTAISPALSLRQFYELAIGALEGNPIDLPFVLLYSVHTHIAGKRPDTNSSLSGDSFTLDPHTTTDEMSNDQEVYTGTVTLRLQASTGLLEEHVAEYRQFQVEFDETDDDVSEVAQPFPFEDAIREQKAVHTFLNEDVARHFANRSWQSQTNRAVVCPVQLESRKLPDCVMVVGLNSRRIYRDIYAKWLDQLTICMRSGIASARKVAREQKHLRNLRRLDEAKTAFFTSVSHELRTPLTLINGPAADALAEKGLSPLNRNRFDLISRASNRLLRLVNSLLDFASVDAGRLKANFTPVYLCSYVEDLASLFRSAVERAGLKFIVSTEGREVVYTDRSAFEKIMFNLLSNALKYTIVGEIKVHAYTTQSDFVMEVSDTGTGIPDDQIEDIFRRFYRVDNKHARAVEGTGIGLALTKELSKLLHGELTVESTTPSGTERGASGSTFRLTLPLGQRHLPLEAAGRDATPSSYSDYSNEFSKRAIADELVGAFGHVGGSGSVDDDAASGGDSGADLAVHREANILVVDDHDDLRNYIMSILGGVCRSVTGVSDGEAALAILKTNARIDLVVTDIMMPKMDGFQLLQSIRSDAQLSNLPVIMLSARAGAEVTAEGIELGATDYLPKPFSSKELTARVRNALANAKKSRRLEALVEERTAELVASEVRAERLMGVLPVGVFESSVEGHITYTNEAFRRMSGWLDTKPFYIDQWYGRIRQEDRGRVRDVVSNALSAGDQRGRNSDNHVASWQWETSSSTDGSRNHCFGQIYHTGNSFVGVLTDITPSIRLAEQSIQHEKQRAHDAINLARSQESFLDVVSHELRNPLSAILNCADLCTSNFEAVAALLDHFNTLEDNPDTQRTLEDVRSELEEAAESIQGIIASARHQSLIAGDILSVSKFNRGLLTVTPVDVCLCRELNTILTMFEMQTRATQIGLSLRLSPEIREDLCLSADPTRLTQILVNLVSNSCRILENYDGFRRCVVECHALATEPSLSIFHKGTDDGLGQLDRSQYVPADAPVGTDIWLLFLVRDTGPGISNEMQAHLFTKFNQAQTNGSMGATRSAVGGGAGLGLYLAKKLAELMGGSMTVKSVVGQGADFIFYIKTTKARYVEAKEALKTRSRAPKYAQRALGQSGTSSRSSFSTVTSLDGIASASASGDPRGMTPVVLDTQSLSGPLTPPPSSRSHLRVLVCEDNLLNQKLLHRQLSKAGIETIVANNGLEAVEKLLQSNREGRPMNVCLMDLEMPVCGGIEAAARIRSLEREGELPGSLVIYAVTGNAREQHAKECKDVGMNSTIVKPYDFRDMLSKLDALQLA